jgi:hypothetical protein
MQIIKGIKMKYDFKFNLLFAILSFTQCLPVSTNSPCDKTEQYYFDENYCGKWKSTDTLQEYFMNILKEDSITYFANIYYKNAGQLDTVGKYLTKLTKINNHIIAIIYPENNYLIKDKGINSDNFLFIPTYSFASVSKLSPDSIKLSFIDSDFLNKKKDKIFNGIRRVIINEGYIIVDNPKKVNLFLSRCLKNEINIFNESIIFYKQK